MTLQPDAKKWLARKGEDFLRKAGLQEGQTVLDFGCNKGNYAKPAAKVVGQAGKVYALDKDAQVLDELGRAAQQEGLRNIECVHVAEDGRIPLPSCSVDVALLYDVFHGGYFPQAEQRKKILRSTHRVLKPAGLLSLYPTHLKKYGMTFKKLIREVEAVGFKPKSESRRTLVHDGTPVRGRIFSFRK